LVFFNGEYHLFYQHNPYGWDWGNMHWGHAVSRDMVHWQELGDTLAPDEMGPMFIGSAVVDWKNISGFGKDGKPPLVLIYTAANSEYAIGTFDGTKFTPEKTKLPGHRGRSFYAAQTFSDIPANDGRRIQIGWFQTATPGMPFNQSMTIPLELKLTATPEGPRLTMNPVKELAALRAKSHRFDAVILHPDSDNPLAGINAELVELQAEFEPGDAAEIAFTVRGATIVFDAKKQELAVNGHRAPAPLRGGKQRLTLFCDRTGLEVFASDGLTYVPMPFQPKAGDLSLIVQAKGGSAKITALQVYELRSAWE